VTITAARIWPFVPAALLLIMLAGLGLMAAIAVDDPGFALERDYYQKAVSYDAEIAQRAENQRLGWSAELTATAATPRTSSTLALMLRDAAGPLAGARVRVEALRNASAARVLSGALTEAAPGQYQVSLPLYSGGLWEFRLVVEREGQRFTSVQRLDVRDGAP
jgi:hypothetical protein